MPNILYLPPRNARSRVWQMIDLRSINRSKVGLNLDFWAPDRTPGTKKIYSELKTPI